MCLDGRAAYDSVSRAAVLSKVRDVAPGLLPFVRAIYGQVSADVWTADDGGQHLIHQAEGIKQGDPLAPGLYALVQHDALAAAARQLDPSDHIVAFLDDIAILTRPQRARAPLATALPAPWRLMPASGPTLGKRVSTTAQGDLRPLESATSGRMSGLAMHRRLTQGDPRLQGPNRLA